MLLDAHLVEHLQMITNVNYSVLIASAYTPALRWDRAKQRQASCCRVKVKEGIEKAEAEVAPLRTECTTD